MKIEVHISEKELRAMVFDHLRSELGDAGAKLKESDVKIETKSAQNYRAEWETAQFRARVEVER